jgi:RNA polymerase sigma-70 factor (ECF subfamily)
VPGLLHLSRRNILLGLPRNTQSRPSPEPVRAARAEPQSQSLEIGELFSRYHHQVSVWIRRLGGPGIEVDDAVQDVFLFALPRLHRFKGQERLVVWLYRITENVVRHQRRSSRRQHRLLSEGANKDQLAANVAAPRQLPPEHLAQGQALQQIYGVLDQMSERNRTLIILFELEELSGQEIAELKGAKVATVWVWLHRARAEFRQRLAEVRGPALTSAGASR